MGLTPIAPNKGAVWRVSRQLGAGLVLALGRSPKLGLARSQRRTNVPNSVP